MYGRRGLTRTDAFAVSNAQARVAAVFLLLLAIMGVKVYGGRQRRRGRLSGDGGSYQYYPWMTGQIISMIYEVKDGCDGTCSRPAIVHFIVVIVSNH